MQKLARKRLVDGSKWPAGVCSARSQAAEIVPWPRWYLSTSGYSKVAEGKPVSPGPAMSPTSTARLRRTLSAAGLRWLMLTKQN